jgi:hypothetical protein
MGNKPAQSLVRKNRVLRGPASKESHVCNFILMAQLVILRCESGFQRISLVGPGSTGCGSEDLIVLSISSLGWGFSKYIRMGSCVL